MKNISRFFFVGLLFSTHTYAISLENDFFDFNTYGQVGSDFGSNFNYYYDDKTKIVSKSSVKNYDQSYKAALDSAYMDRSLTKGWNLRVGKLPLIDTVDYQKLGEDIKKITIDDKINNYDGLNVRYNTPTDLGHLYVNNIYGRYKTSKDDDSYYDNVAGSSITLKDEEYKFRIGHSLIEPSMKKLNTGDATHGMISSMEFNYIFDSFKHSNEIVKKNYYDNDKVIHSFKTNLEYTVNTRFKPYTEYQEEYDQWQNGQKVWKGGVKLNLYKNFNIVTDYKKVYRTYSSYENIAQESNAESIVSLGMTLKY